MKNFSVGIALIFCSCFVFVDSQAEFVETFGTLNTTGVTFSCESVPGASAKVVLTQSSGQTKKLQKKAAIRMLEKIRKALKKRSAQSRQVIKRKQRQLKNLTDAFGALLQPGFQERVAKLREDIQKLEERLPVLTADISFIAALKQQIRGCNTVKGLNAGSNIFVTETGNTPVNSTEYYMLGAFHLFDATPLKGGQTVCRRDPNGQVKSETLSSSFCFTFQDREVGGPGRGPDFRDCINAPQDLPPKTGVFFLSKGAGYFHQNTFDQVSATVQGALAQTFELFAPNASGSCF
ncbi:MAG: hypothetical protein KDD70_06325 [Bdellovibrionales bacterium]|nr:hypothetical protein [Bdellovibrionales bacterium]